MKLFLVIQTESTDVSFLHIDEFSSVEQAKSRLIELFSNYQEDSEDQTIIQSHIEDDAMCAYHENEDGAIVCWSIRTVAK